MRCICSRGSALENLQALPRFLARFQGATLRPRERQPKRDKKAAIRRRKETDEVQCLLCPGHGLVSECVMFMHSSVPWPRACQWVCHVHALFCALATALSVSVSCSCTLLWCCHQRLFHISFQRPVVFFCCSLASCLINSWAFCHTPRICNLINSLISWCVRLLNHIYLTQTTLYLMKIPFQLIKIRTSKK